MKDIDEAKREKDFLTESVIIFYKKKLDKKTSLKKILKFLNNNNNINEKVNGDEDCLFEVNEKVDSNEDCLFEFNDKLDGNEKVDGNEDCLFEFNDKLDINEKVDGNEDCLFEVITYSFNDIQEYGLCLNEKTITEDTFIETNNLNKKKENNIKTDNINILQKIINNKKNLVIMIVFSILVIFIYNLIKNFNFLKKEKSNLQTKQITLQGNVNVLINKNENLIEENNLKTITLENNHKTELEKLIEKNNSETDKLKNKHKIELEILTTENKNHKTEVDTLIKKHKTEVDTLIKKHQTEVQKITTENDKHKIELEMLTTENNNQKIENDNHKIELERLTTENNNHKTELDQLKLQLTLSLQKNKNSYKKNFLRIETNTEKKNLKNFCSLFTEESSLNQSLLYKSKKRQPLTESKEKFVNNIFITQNSLENSENKKYKITENIKKQYIEEDYDNIKKTNGNIKEDFCCNYNYFSTNKKDLISQQSCKSITSHRKSPVSIIRDKNNDLLTQLNLKSLQKNNKKLYIYIEQLKNGNYDIITKNDDLNKKIVINNQEILEKKKVIESLAERIEELILQLNINNQTLRDISNKVLSPREILNKENIFRENITKTIIQEKKENIDKDIREENNKLKEVIYNLRKNNKNLTIEISQFLQTEEENKELKEKYEEIKFINLNNILEINRPQEDTKFLINNLENYKEETKEKDIIIFNQEIVIKENIGKINSLTTELDTVNKEVEKITNQYYSWLNEKKELQDENNEYTIRLNLLKDENDKYKIQLNL
jgi:hypothetical protein